MGRRAIELAAAAGLVVMAGAAHATAASGETDGRSCGDVDPASRDRADPVRPRDAFARYLIIQGNERSATFARLVAVLERCGSDQLPSCPETLTDTR